MRVLFWLSRVHSVKTNPGVKDYQIHFLGASLHSLCQNYHKETLPRKSEMRKSILILRWNTGQFRLMGKAKDSRPVVLGVEGQGGHHLGTSQKCAFLPPPQTCWIRTRGAGRGAGPAVSVLSSPPVTLMRTTHWEPLWGLFFQWIASLSMRNPRP